MEPVGTTISIGFRRLLKDCVYIHCENVNPVPMHACMYMIRVEEMSGSDQNSIPLSASANHIRLLLPPLVSPVSLQHPLRLRHRQRG